MVVHISNQFNNNHVFHPQISTLSFADYSKWNRKHRNTLEDQETQHLSFQGGTT